MTRQEEIDEMLKNEIVMTPYQRMGVTTVKIERLPRNKIDYTLMHYAATPGGPYAGIIVNKAVNDEPEIGTPHAMFALKVYMSDAGAENPETEMVEEQREFRFWFHDPEDTDSHAANANEFFQEIIDPEEFPKDYIGFIKRVVVLVRKYLLIKRMELEINPMFSSGFGDESELSQNRTQQEQHVDTVTTKTATIEKSPSLKRSGSFKERRIPTKKGRILIWVAKKQRLLNVLEDAYPNTMAMGELCRLAGFSKSDMETASYMLNDLMEKGLVKEIENGRWMRLPKSMESNDSSAKTQHEVRVVKDLPQIKESDQPSIAVITLLYCEKLAVDAMMERKTTFVKYKTEGESQVYTIGMIGPHKVVTTKLARIGNLESAMISAGNTITRLLGTFNKIEHVLLVGVGGGVPNFENASQHPRLGDVIVSMSTDRDGPVYIHCGKLEKDKSFMTQTYAPRDSLIQDLILAMQQKSETDSYFGRPWERYREQAMKVLQSEQTRFDKPPASCDKLFRTVNGERVEVVHPGGEDDTDGMRPMTIIYGPVGSGRPIVKSEEERIEFAMVTGVAGYDADYHVVLDSIEGNRKDSFVLIRGISDYVDGTKKKFEWQAYGALSAAAYMKALILSFPVEEPLSQV